MKSSKGLLKRFWLLAIIAIFFLIIISGCAKKEAIKQAADEDILRERIMAYWNHRVNGEFEKAYEYEYSLKGLTVTKYIELHSNPMLTYRSYELRSILKKAEDVAEVEMKVVPVAKAPGAKPFEHEVIITERWVKVNDVWYHVSK